MNQAAQQLFHEVPFLLRREVPGHYQDPRGFEQEHLVLRRQQGGLGGGGGDGEEVPQLREDEGDLGLEETLVDLHEAREKIGSPTPDLPRGVVQAPVVQKGTLNQRKGIRMNNLEVKEN